MTSTSRDGRRWKRVMGAVLLCGAVGVVGGCSNAGQGAISGAGLGALGGLAIGSLYGDAGKGAAIGAVAGGLGGAILGDQNERAERRSRQSGYYDDW